MFPSSSIKRLRFAFVAMAGLTILGLVVGTITFAFSYMTQKRFLAKTTPFLVNVEELSRASVRFTATIQELQAIVSPAHLERVLAEHRGELDALQAGIRSLLDQGAEVQSAEGLNHLVHQLVALETPYVEALRLRADASGRLNELRREISQETRFLLDRLSPFLLDASLEMVGLIRSVNEESETRVDKLHGTLNEVQLLTEISFAAEKFLQAISTIDKNSGNSPSAPKELIAPEFRHLTQLALKLDDPNQQALLVTSLGFFNERSLEADGIADQSRRLAHAILQLDRLSEDQVQLITQLTDIVNRVVKNARDDFFETAERTQQASLAAVSALAVLSIIAFLSVVWIGWRLINRDIAHRLERLARSTVALASGDLNIQVDQSGSDELAGMAKAVEVFRQNALELQNSQKELSAYARELERSNAELDDFAYIASHDLKEPLRAAYNHASFLIEDYEDRLGDDGQNRLHRLMALNQRMEKLVADLLYFSRLGRGEEALETLDLNAIIDEVETNLTERLQTSNAKIAVSGSLPKVHGIRTHVTVLLQNLISNGIKYNEAHEKLIEIGKVPSGSLENSEAFETFYVSDNGIGIEDEFRDEVFRIFKRLNNEKTYGEGTGAGLSFVKKIVERQGGQIWFESRPGEGTTFYFALRAVKADIDTTENLQAA